jgi:hypothetical protein
LRQKNGQKRFRRRCLLRKVMQEMPADGKNHALANAAAVAANFS